MGGWRERRDEGMWCPGCKREVGSEHFACVSGAKGGASGTGRAKARSSEQARAAAEARWKRKGVLVVPSCSEGSLGAGDESMEDV